MYEFGLIVCFENGFETFEENWELWRSAIIQYSQASQNKPKAIQKALQELVPGESGNMYILTMWLKVELINTLDVESLIALRCLAFFLMTKSRKAGRNVDPSSIVVPHYLMEGMVSYTRRVPQ